MLMILLTTILVGLGIGVILWIVTAVAQGYFYESPADDLICACAAAAGAISLFLFVWMLVEYRRPGVTDTLFSFSSTRTTEFSKFISVRKDETGAEKDISFERRAGRNQFLDPKGTVWARSSSGMMIAIIVEENGEQKRFNAELKDGKFATRRPNEPLRFQEVGGKSYILENELGKIYSSNRGRLALMLFINLLFFAVWFAVMWPLLRFQWPHALLFAAGGWLIATLIVAPYMLGRARTAAEKRAKVTASLIDPRARPGFASLAWQQSGRAGALDGDGGREILAEIGLDRERLVEFPGLAGNKLDGQERIDAGFLFELDGQAVAVAVDFGDLERLARPLDDDIARDDFADLDVAQIDLIGNRGQQRLDVAVDHQRQLPERRVAGVQLQFIFEVAGRSILLQRRDHSISRSPSAPRLYAFELDINRIVVRRHVLDGPIRIGEMLDFQIERFFLTGGHIAHTDLVGAEEDVALGLRADHERGHRRINLVAGIRGD